MAEVKKFSGYTAIDGSAHNTKKEAIEYSRDIKIKAALDAIVTGFVAKNPDESGGYFVPELGVAALLESNLATWLTENRVTLLAAFNQDVKMRAPRAPKKPAAPPAAP